MGVRGHGRRAKCESESKATGGMSKEGKVTGAEKRMRYCLAFLERSFTRLTIPSYLQHGPIKPIFLY